MLKKIYRLICSWFDKIPVLPRDICTTLFFMCIAYFVSDALIGHTGAENNSALVYVLCVVFISLLTTGYFYGILASLFGAFCINYYFMYPYASFSLSQSGYPVATFSMLVISVIVCALTARQKLLTAQARRREEKTKALYELNAKLNEEKTAIQLKAARETIHSNILRGVSHDLRTPLTAISGAASVLLSSEEPRSERDISLLNDIKSDANALITMVENLLSITRIQGNSVPLIKREEMLEEVAGDAILTTRRRFPDAKVQLELSEDILFLPMEPLLIKQVMLNLLENAIRHSGDDQHIRLHLFREDDWAVVEVSDQGKGLTPEVIRAVETGHALPRDLSGDSTRGMGIGLSVCQSIIKAHGGFFTAANRPEGGAIFRFGLPAEEPNL